MTGTVVRMLLLIRVWGQKSADVTLDLLVFFQALKTVMKSLMPAVYRDLQSRVLDGCGQGRDPCGALHGRQHLCAVGFECGQNQ